MYTYKSNISKMVRPRDKVTIERITESYTVGSRSIGVVPMIFSNTIFGAIGEYCVHYIGNISLTKYGQSAYRHSLFQANNCFLSDLE